MKKINDGLTALQRYQAKESTKQKIKEAYKRKRERIKAKREAALKILEELTDPELVEQHLQQQKEKKRLRETAYQRLYRERPGVRERINAGQERRRRKKLAEKRKLKEENPKLYAKLYPTKPRKKSSRKNKPRRNLNLNLLSEEERIAVEKRRAKSREYYYKNKDKYKEAYLKQKEEDAKKKSLKAKPN